MIPGANVDLKGAVPAGIVVPVYGAHLRKQAREDSMTTAEAAAPDINLPDKARHSIHFPNNNSR